jgi:hypothetical protein
MHLHVPPAHEPLTAPQLTSPVGQLHAGGAPEGTSEQTDPGMVAQLV